MRVALSLFAVVAGALIFACGDQVDAAPGAVHVLTADGTVNPVMDGYIDRGIDEAEEDEATAVVIKLNTPGGLLSSTDDIDTRILAAEVPVVVYVSPPGGQAASAGTFITYASHVAAMAPGTVIGSATPVGSGGEDIEGDLGNKIENNAVAKITGFAELRGRNAEWAEAAVREGISATATEALDLGVVEYVAEDLDDLLQQIDGVEVDLQNGQEVTIRSAGAQVAYNNENLIEQFLGIIADPNIAFILLSLGSLALFIEIMNPGSIFPGVFGVISLILGFFALSVLPFNWAGVALIVFAFILFGLELFLPSGGILGIGGVVALIFGGLLLTSDNPPEFQVSGWLVFGLAAFLGCYVLLVAVSMMRMRHAPALVGRETIVGRTVYARSPLDPSGFVMMDGEYWAAEAVDGPVEQGEPVTITAINGLRLTVKKAAQPEGGTDGGNTQQRA
jgi:membrane-bound serine protease (ClpP class)